MSTIAEVQEALPKLNNEELRQVEQSLRQLYRSRNAGVIFDDAYGIWTEADQASAGAEAFALFDREEARHDKPPTR
jgi:preprotein translocase subunit SecA